MHQLFAISEKDFVVGGVLAKHTAIELGLLFQLVGCSGGRQVVGMDVR